MKAKVVIELSDAFCKEVSDQLSITTAEELQGVLKCVWADGISQASCGDVKLSVEVEE